MKPLNILSQPVTYDTKILTRVGTRSSTKISSVWEGRKWGLGIFLDRNESDSRKINNLFISSKNWDIVKSLAPPLHSKLLEAGSSFFFTFTNLSLIYCKCKMQIDRDHILIWWRRNESPAALPSLPGLPFLCAHQRLSVYTGILSRSCWQVFLDDYWRWISFHIVASKLVYNTRVTPTSELILATYDQRYQAVNTDFLRIWSSC